MTKNQILNICIHEIFDVTSMMVGIRLMYLKFRCDDGRTIVSLVVTFLLNIKCQLKFFCRCHDLKKEEKAWPFLNKKNVLLTFGVYHLVFI